MNRALLCLVLLLAPAAAVAGSLGSPLLLSGTGHRIQVSTSTSASTSVGWDYPQPGQVILVGTSTSTTTAMEWVPLWASHERVHPMIVGTDGTIPVGTGGSSSPWPWWAYALSGSGIGAVAGLLTSRRRRAGGNFILPRRWRCRICGEHGTAASGIASAEIDHCLLTECRGDLVEEQRGIQ
jgi:hypothetical protein